MPTLLRSLLAPLQRRLTDWLDHVAPRSCALCGLLLPPGALTGTCVGCLMALPGAQRPRCHRCALPLETDPPRATEHCAACRQEALPAPWVDQTLTAADYAPPLDRAITTLKFGRQLAMARPLGELLAARWRGNLAPVALDCLIPVPLSEARLAQRGFNQALELARGMNHGLARRLPIHARALRRVRDTPAQTSLALHERQHNLRDALVCQRRLDGLRVGLIDDVMTSGSTLNEAARVLKQAGAAQVLALVVARTA